MGYIKDLMTLAHGEAYTDELFHFGIKGMKWGVRRYQNADGSLTPAGEKRYYGKANKIQKDIDSFAPFRKTGIKNKKGKLVLTKEEIGASIKGLEVVRDNARRKGDAKRKKDYAKLQRRLTLKEVKSLKNDRQKTQPRLKNNPTDRDIENYVNDLIGAGRVTDKERAEIKRKYHKKSN